MVSKGNPGSNICMFLVEGGNTNSVNQGEQASAKRTERTPRKWFTSGKLVAA